MSDAASVEFVGVGPAMADLRRWADQLGPAVDKVTVPLAERVAETVRSRVPVLTGQLAGSVEVDPAGDGVDVAMGGGLAYAGWIEFGGSRGRPLIPEGRYLYPSALDAQDEFIVAAAEVADDTVGGFPWSTPR